MHKNPLIRYESRFIIARHGDIVARMLIRLGETTQFQGKVMTGVGHCWKVEYNTPVSVVRVTPQFTGFNPLILRKRFPPEIKDSVLAAFSEGVVNEDTGLLVGMSGRDFAEHMSFKEYSTGRIHLEAVSALPELMRTAKLIKSHSDYKATLESKIKRVHRFIAAFGTADGDDYAILLTVKEFEDAVLNPDIENPVRLYHHRVEKQMLSVTSTQALIEPRPSSTTPSIIEYTISELLADVKDSTGNLYL
jgi:hypothetical protein